MINFTNDNYSEYSNTISEHENLSGNEAFQISNEINENRENNVAKKRRRSKHTKYSTDNVKRKINVHYLNFLVCLINLIVKDILGEQYDEKTMKFFNFKYKFRKNITNSRLNDLKNKNISILSYLTENDNISNKGFINYNDNVYNRIININNLITNILNKSCFEYFNIFYKKPSEFDLKKYSINKIVDLSNITCFYEDTFKSEYINDQKYIEKIEKVIKKFFLEKDLFIVKKY